MFLISRAVLRSSTGRRCSSLYSPEQVFSEANISKTIAKFESLKPIIMMTQQPVKKAAVLIPLCVVDHKVSLLYTLRAARLKSHRGQVSFPGGMQDVTDQSLEDTALRETEEELGIKPEDVEVWGRGNIIVTRMETCVMPVIGRIKPNLKLQELNVNSHEVEDVFTVSLEDLCNPDKLKYTQFRGLYSAPVFLGGKLRIWGLTGLITNMFLSSLLPQKAYAHKIKYIPPVKVGKSKGGLKTWISD